MAGVDVVRSLKLHAAKASNTPLRVETEKKRSVTYQTGDREWATLRAPEPSKRKKCTIINAQQVDRSVGRADPILDEITMPKPS
jgi:hypothetical protein